MLVAIAAIALAPVASANAQTCTSTFDQSQLQIAPHLWTIRTSLASSPCRAIRPYDRDSSGHLWGADTAGALWESSDDGRSWVLRYTLPADWMYIRAILVTHTDHVLLAALDSSSRTHILRSNDTLGTSFSDVFQLPVGSTIRDGQSWVQTSAGIFMGEYGDPNPVHLWRSTDDGLTFQTAFALPGGQTGVRHIHGVFRDPYVAGRLWVTWGDTGGQPRIGYSDDGGQTFTYITRVAYPQSRAVALVFAPDAVYWATDSPEVPAGLFRWDRSTGAVTQVMGNLNGPWYNTEQYGSYAVQFSQVDIAGPPDDYIGDESMHALTTGDNGTSWSYTTLPYTRPATFQTAKTYVWGITAPDSQGRFWVTLANTTLAPNNLITVEMSLGDSPAPIPSPTVSSVSVAATPSAIAADGQSTSTVTATPLEDNGIPVPGQRINFSVSDSQVSIGAPSSDGTRVSVPLTASTLAGTVTITATDASPGENAQGTGSVQLLPWITGGTAHLLYPLDGATGIDVSHPFTWTAISGAQSYYLYVGSAQGTHDLIDSGALTKTSYLASALPANTALWARLWTDMAGQWTYQDVRFTTGSPIHAPLQTPANGAQNVDPDESFTWAAIPGADSYYLDVGTSQGASDVIDSGAVVGTSYTSDKVPSNSQLWARLWTHLNGVWSHSQDVTFTTGQYQKARLIYPTSGATGVDTSRAFTWTAIPNAQAYYLDVGTSQGAQDVVNSGELSSTYYQVPPMPSGQSLWARLWTKLNGVWRYVDASFQVLPAYPHAVLIYPDQNTQELDPTLPFEWTSVPGAQGYYLYIGSSAGANDILDTGLLQRTSYHVGNLPVGQLLFARIWTELNSQWSYEDVTITSIDPTWSTLTYPQNGDSDVAAGQAFIWSTVPSAQAYYLYVGTSQGADDLVNTGQLPPTQTSYTPTSLPTGQVLWARVWTKVDGIWHYYGDTSFELRAS